MEPEKQPMMSTSEITEKRSSSGSSGSMDSVEKRKSIQRVQSARLRAKRKQKPLVGDRALRTLNRAPLLVKAFLIIVLTGLPFAIFMGFAYTKYPDRTIGENNLHVTYKQLSLWLSIAWASFLIIFTLAEVAGRTGARLCRLSVHTIKYAPLAQTMWFRLTMIAWVGTLHEATCRIWPISEDKTIHGNWVWQLRQAFMFLTIAFSIVFVQGLFLQLIAIQYVEGYVGPRSERADNELDIIRDLNNLIKPHVSDLGLVAKILRRIFMPIESNCFADIRHGQCEDKKVRTYAASIWNTIAGSKSQITMQDITARLVEMDRDPLKAEELFLMLDESCDNHVTREELERLVVKTAIQLRKRAAAMRGIQLLLHKLEVLLTLLVFGIIIFIYTNFFPQDWAKDLRALWTGIVALSFAFAAPVAEVVNACVFVFAKHAYDVGDFVNIKDRKLVVRRIFLTHTNFEEVQGPDERGRVVQMSHSVLSGEVIVNWTRSNDVLVESGAEVKVEAK